MNKLSLVLSCTLLLAFIGRAQSYQKTETGFKAVVDTLQVEVQFYSPSIVRILKSPIPHSFKKESLSVIKTPEKTALRIKQQGDILDVESDKIRVSLNTKSGAVNYYAQKGALLLKELAGSTTFTPFDDA